jgi:hypothetical protein
VAFINGLDILHEDTGADVLISYGVGDEYSATLQMSLAEALTHFVGPNNRLRGD